LCAEAVRFAAGLEGSVVEEVADAGVPAHGSPPNISDPLDLLWVSPRTSASKSMSPFPLAVSSPLLAATPPKLMKSFRDAETVVDAPVPSSCSFRVCSFSTRDDNDFMRAMYAWNCARLSSGPRLNCHNIGRTSIAKKSAST
jgi:hypothetical protein